ncbi:putative quinol monooxygenase [Gordonia westfalica]|uniref:Antibiotic biosynthesis monooxygenase n=1 Tax=Gordonia westfalica TaxID=158898 RepID=A0A1H2H6R2_9ACTN|nr:antibiotic biosynthesis monooxygenase [Gordonia westfalica]SDU27248.1 Antibiotic biosynthesis monooxygenase [Gordonia westfalica]
MQTSMRVRGQLVCRTPEELATVLEALPLHAELTRKEPGCVSFEVSRTEDPYVFDVDEVFVDASAYELHRQRLAASEWGRRTAGVERRYAVEESTHTDG